MSAAYVLGVDLGGTNLRLGAVDEAGSLHAPVRHSAAGLAGEQAAEKLLAHIRGYIKAAALPLRGVAIGFPSTLNKARTALISTPNLPGLDGLALRAQYEEALGLPVWLDKDATMLLRHDLLHHGIAADDGVIAGIYVGTGLGNCILVNGRPLLGRNGVACELGHVPVPGRRGRCGCGLRGCLELYAGGKALQALRRRHFPQTPIEEMFRLHGSAPPVQRYVETVADAIALEVNLLNPDWLVIGGGVPAMPGFPVEELARLVRGKARRPVPGGDMRLVFAAAQQPFGGVVGAGLHGHAQWNGGNV